MRENNTQGDTIYSFNNSTQLNELVSVFKGL